MKELFPSTSFLWRGFRWRYHAMSDAIVAYDGVQRPYASYHRPYRTEYRAMLNEWIVEEMQSRKIIFSSHAAWDDVPWEINVIPNASAYKAARDAYLADRD